MRDMDKNGGFSIYPDKVEFSKEPSFESDPLEIDEHNWLTRREIEVLTWVAEGKTDKEIGVILNVSSRTVSKHLEHIYIKLGVDSRTGAVLQLFEIMQQTRGLKKEWKGAKGVKMFGASGFSVGREKR